MPQVIHVTGALSILDRGYGHISVQALEKAAHIGVETHRHALAAIRGFYVPAPPDIEFYVEKVMEWHKKHISEVLGTEIEVKIPNLGVIGHCDLVAKFNGDRAWSVIDLKRVNAVPKWVGLQLAAYQRGLEIKLRKKISRRVALKVPDDGHCVAVEFKDHEIDYVAFTYALFLQQHLGG